MRRVCAAVASAALIALSVVAIPATARPPASAKHATAPGGPFVTAAMRAFLATRSGDITAAAYNVETGRLFLYRPGVHGDDASIAKVDILATALYEAQEDHTCLLYTSRCV